MKKLFILLALVFVSFGLVSAHEFYMGNVSFNDVEKVIAVPRKIDTFRFEKTLMTSDTNEYIFQYIIVRSGDKVFSTFSTDFITDAPIVDGKHLYKDEQKKYLKE